MAQTLTTSTFVQPLKHHTAIVASSYFIRQADLDDTFKIAEILVHDYNDFVQKPVGGWIREAGKQDRKRLLAFLDTHAAGMPRTVLRYAIEHLPDSKRQYYLGPKQATK